ncbi:MAG: hypothetical protein JWM36_4611 [Hyphomicrobiales bacterium]|nr:hypothetical protein [Hyphomicrobiales bacterium]
MPTVLRWQGYRFFFYSADGLEPPHVHVVRAGKEAKIWLNDLSIAVNLGYSTRELNEILLKAKAEQDMFVASWRDYFGA